MTTEERLVVDLSEADDSRPRPAAAGASPQGEEPPPIATEIARRAEGEPPGLSPFGWSAVVVGALVVAGALLPFLGASGSTSTIAPDTGRATAVLIAGLAMVLGGLLSGRPLLGPPLAAGAALTFLGVYALTLRTVVAVTSADPVGARVVPHVGFWAWTLAALGCVGLVVRGVPAVRGEPLGGWVPVAAAGGLGLYWFGLLVPPTGLSVSEHLFGGDGWTDAAVVLLLAGIPLGAGLLATCRTAAAGMLALGVAAPWAASWFVYVVDGRPGGLPIAFADAPALAGAALGLGSLCAVSGLWWHGAAVPSTPGAIGTALTGGQAMALAICGGAVVMAVGATATTDRGSQIAFFTGPGTGDIALPSGYRPAPDPPPFEPPVDECVASYCERYPEQADFIDELIERSDSEDFTVSGGGQWIAQLQANSVDSPESSIRETYEELLAAGIPEVRVVVSDEYGSMPDGFLTFFNPGPFRDGPDALAFCRRHGRDTANLCFARFLSDDPADRALDRYPG